MNEYFRCPNCGILELLKVRSRIPPFRPPIPPFARTSLLQAIQLFAPPIRPVKNYALARSLPH
jgi:DNA-directed RNA polymerase subunit RPC12/RpoP